MKVLSLQLLYLLICFIQAQGATTGPCDVSATISKCSGDKLLDDKCLSKYLTRTSTKKTTYLFLRNCGNSETCKEIAGDTNTHNYGICIPRIKSRFTDEKCVVNSECFSLKCIDKKCQAVADGEECVNDADCSKTSACVSENQKGICTAMVAAGGDCKFQDNLCPFDYACGAEAKGGASKCLKMFSLDNGKYSTHPLLCKSGYIYKENLLSYDISESGAQDSNADNFCADATTPTDTKCTSYDNCKYTITYGDKSLPNLTGNCICSLDGVSGFCPLGTDAEAWRNWLTVYAEEIANIVPEDFKHLGYARTNYWENQKIHEANVRKTKYSQIQTGDECAIRYLMTGSYNSIQVLGLILFVLLLF